MANIKNVLRPLNHNLNDMKKAKLNLDCSQCQYKATSAFCNLAPKEIESLNLYKQTINFKKKETIFYEGEYVKGLYCVHQGNVKLYKILNNGNIQILRLAKSSDLIGYRALFGNGQYIASAETLSDATICFIPKEKIFELISNNLNFTLKLMSKIAADISEVEEKAINFIQKTSQERLAEALLLLEKTFGNDNNGYINIHLTRIELAGITGMAIETITRILRIWESDKIVILNKKLIKILNSNSLLELANIID